MQPKQPSGTKVSPTAEELFAAFKAGYHALGELVELHRDYLLQICNDDMAPELRARSGGSDIVQESFLDVIEHLHRGLLAVSTQDDLKKWLRRVWLVAKKVSH